MVQVHQSIQVVHARPVLKASLVQTVQVSMVYHQSCVHQDTTVQLEAHQSNKYPVLLVLSPTRMASQQHLNVFHVQLVTTVLQLRLIHM